MGLFKFLILLCLIASVFSVDLYGMRSPAELVKVNSENGTITPVGGIYTHEAVGDNVGCLDSKNGIYYFMGTNLETAKIDLLGMDIHSADIKYTIPTTFVTEGFVGVAQIVQCIDDSDDVIIMGRDPKYDHKHNLVRVTPQTNTWKELNQFNFLDPLGGGHTLSGETVWIELTVNISGKYSHKLFGFDINTGKQVFEINDDDYYTTGLNYDKESGMVFGIGIVPQFTNRVIMQLNPKTGIITRLFDLPSTYFLATPPTTINAKDGIGWYIMNDRKVDEPWKLVTLDYNKQAIVKNVNLCPNPKDCLRGLEYYEI
ncbi:hypothetical protein M0813_24628 [Anaeramoeba flamelloides]|uniref:Uncharacterized protein n=1 Tax=Anaeramoeba flamelloides TaxID=1746091 RepID=A0ABQ8Y580_9EUKA|nr:hypothetical protein M0813_24628 [Anaeramoeba flamelloides]